ncbi:Alcohol dehydrogenase [Candidatus Sumerlaea chitinivorans]|uniref:Alcohol dehydrogenase n=1 Tax=Sumerlaea chitinivorans TaxID=2250252 RepID=A0A2Z4Y4C6_SUMC1|nr:Alcohol dehydrogenase [Candidatus Sumerlaea chitinivorans]
MKAAVFEEAGDLEKLVIRDLPDPTPGPGQVLVQVKACALNHLDLWARRGAFNIALPMPHISGSDVCGIVAALGEGVHDWTLGERVIIAPGQGCGQCEACRAGHDSYCDQYKIFGFQTQGGYAEFAVTEARHLIRVSRNLSYEEWAAVPLTFLTAYHMLFSLARLQPGETVLVHACGSGVGVAAIQLAHLGGACVIATSASDHKLRRAQRELGVENVVNYDRENVVKHVMHLTNGRGVDVVIDPVGPAVWEDSLAILRRGGRLVNCAATTGMETKISVRTLYARQISLMGSYMGFRYELDKVVRLAECGRIRPIVDKTYRLEDARLAQERMENRENFGKIVLVMNSNFES